MKFELGQIYLTKGIREYFSCDIVLVSQLVFRHGMREWGDLDAEDRKANEDAIKNGERIVSVYHTQDEKIYVITEWDRSMTTVLLADEY